MARLEILTLTIPVVGSIQEQASVEGMYVLLCPWVRHHPAIPLGSGNLIHKCSNLFINVSLSTRIELHHATDFLLLHNGLG